MHLNDISITARGGPSYASTTAVWRNLVLGNAVSEVEGVGNDRRLPLCIRGCEGNRLWIIQVYLPLLQSNLREEEWQAEVNDSDKM